MLRRQQAAAVVAARQTLVVGTVCMVEMALAMLSEKKVVELDDERRAAMVANLMVVLCGERYPQPVLNTGTLYSRCARAGDDPQGLCAPDRPGIARRHRTRRRRRFAQRQRPDRNDALRGAGAALDQGEHRHGFAAWAAAGQNQSDPQTFGQYAALSSNSAT